MDIDLKHYSRIFGELKSVGNGLKRDKKPSTIREMQKMIKNCDCSKFWRVNKYTDDIYGQKQIDYDAWSNLYEKKNKKYQVIKHENAQITN